MLCTAAATVILPNLNLAARQQEGVPLSLSGVVHPQQLFKELKQHSRLLSRPRFLAALHNEQLALAKQVGAQRPKAESHSSSGVWNLGRGGAGAVRSLMLTPVLHWSHMLLSKSHGS